MFNCIGESKVDLTVEEYEAKSDVEKEQETEKSNRDEEISKIEELISEVIYILV